MLKKYTVTNYDSIFDITKPSNLLSLPELLPILGLHISESNETLYNYCDMITLIDGIGPECDGCNIYTCDFCMNDCESQYYYCYDCHNDICNLCYENQNILCKQHDVRYREPIYSFVRCYQCNQVILDDTLYGVDEHRNTIYSYDKQPSNESDDDVFTLCIKCSKTEKGQIIINEKSLLMIKNNIISLCDCSDFGSIDDWVQIYYDDMNNMILFNVNVDAKLAGKYAITGSYDKYSSVFCFSLNLQLDQIKEKLEEFYKTNMENNDFDLYPIQQLMDELKLQYKYPLDTEYLKQFPPFLPEFHPSLYSRNCNFACPFTIDPPWLLTSLKKLPNVLPEYK